jgi:hypothetical protein
MFNCYVKFVFFLVWYTLVVFCGLYSYSVKEVRLILSVGLAFMAVSAFVTARTIKC